MSEVRYYQDAPVLDTEAQVRVEAADWLNESVRLMNTNGLHWVKSNYMTEVFVDAEENPDVLTDPTAKKQKDDDPERTVFRITAWCMMGGVQEVRRRRFRFLLDNFQDKLGLHYKRADLVQGELEQTPVWKQVYIATEVALAWASLIHSGDLAANMDEYKKYVLVKAALLDPDENQDLFYAVVDGYTVDDVHQIFHEIVTNTNDADQTEWADIAKIHEIAVKGLLDGKAPVGWKQYGLMLAEEDPNRKKQAEAEIQHMKEERENERHTAL